jgi:fumarate hydratase subunit beta
VIAGGGECCYNCRAKGRPMEKTLTETLNITSPLAADVAAGLTVGTRVRISGVIYTGRDAAHKRLVASLDAGEEMPVDLRGQTIYYVGPSPAPPGHVIGSAGPTTSSRMDVFTPRLMEAGLRAMIGKGGRSAEVRTAIQRHGGVYFVAVGGAAALIARSIKRADIIAYEDLGTEAIRRLEIEDFPAIVANDAAGGDIFEAGQLAYRREG